ncbi:hypothetical protein [Algibacter sp. 2305UL17-15]|uniref:hypothetical protein n=1 Tax=Algibacter sp. 2305UL17-15 TaxID=3231268 RepID=UPI00345888D7
MNRRFFLTTGALGLSSVSVFPSSIVQNNNFVSLADFGKGFYSLYKKTTQRYVTSLSNSFIEAHKEILISLTNKGYVYNNLEVTVLGESCFIIPLKKSSMLGFNSKELAIIIEKEEGGFSHYILNEYQSIGLNNFIENFDKNIEVSKLDINVLKFITPVKVLKESIGKESVFAFENALKNKIVLRSSSKKQLVSIS